MAVLVSGIPLIGPLLAPLVATLSMLYGAGIGSMMEKGDYSTSPYSAAIEAANKFFELLIHIFKGVEEYWNAKS